MRPGLYRLTRDVRNPAPDRRSKDFNKALIWPKGTRVVAVFRRPDSVPEDGGVDLVYLFGSYEHLGVSRRRPGFDELLAAMELEPRSLDTVMRKNPRRGLRDVMQRLLAAGKVTLDDIEGAL